MAIALQGTASTFETASGTTAVIPYPAGVVAGELLIAHVMNSTNVLQTTPPSGWTYLTGQVGGSSTSGPSGTIYYKWAAGGETGTVTFPGQAAAGRITGYMVRWSGVDATTPFDVSAVSNGAFVDPFVMPSITTITPGAMLVHMMGISSTTSFDIGTLAGTTKIAGSTGTGRRHSIFYELRAAAGATGSRTWTLDAGAASVQNWSGITIAMRPTTSAPTAFHKGTGSVAESASATSISIPYPSGIAAGELLTAHITHSAPIAPQSNPGGWVLAASRNAANTGSTTEPSSSVWYKIATGGESGSNVTFGTNGTAGRVTGTIHRWGNIDATNPIDVTPTSAAHSGTFSVVTPPALSTTTSNVLLIHHVVANSASTPDISTPTGVTKLTTNTLGTGRKQTIYSEVQADAGPSTERTFSLVPNDTLVAMHAITIPIRGGSSGGGGDNPGGPVGPQPGTSPTLVQRMTGIPADPKTNGVVQVKMTGGVSARLRVSTDAAGTTGVVYGSTFTPDSMGNVRLTVSGLTPDTRYYYRVMMTNSSGGEFADTASAIGRFWTAPQGAASFSFSFASCMVNTNSAALRTIGGRANQDKFFLHLGDFYYHDGSGTGIDNFRNRFNARIQLADSQACYSQMGMTYTPSDHDGMNNNGSAGSDPTAWANWNTARNELFPMPNSYYSFAWGRVRFIQIDTRSFKTNPSATDNSSKTALGATQKQWLKDQITNMTAEGVAVIIQDAPWIDPTSAGGDSWDGFNTERTELANFFIASGKNICMLSGDAHSICADSGVNSPGGIAVFHGSPLVNNSSIKGGPYSAGVWPSSAGISNISAFGVLNVTDTGGSTITLGYQGIDAGGGNVVRITLTKNYAVAISGIANVAVTKAVGEVDMPEPTVSTSAAPSIVGAQRATATASALPPVVTASAGSNVTAPRAQVNSNAVPPSVTSGIQTVTPRATASAQAFPPFVEGIGFTTVNAPVATGSVAVLPPFVLGQFGAETGAVRGIATAQALPPSVSGDVSREVFAVTAEVYSDAHDPIVTAQTAATVTAVVATGSSKALNPIFGAGVGITLPIARATADAVPPSTTVGFAVEAVVAVGYAAALPVGIGPSVLTVVATALAVARPVIAGGEALVTVGSPPNVSSQAYAVTVEGLARVVSPLATVGVDALDAELAYGANLTPPAASSTARAIEPFAQGTGAITIFTPLAFVLAKAEPLGITANMPLAPVARVYSFAGGPIVQGGINVAAPCAGVSVKGQTPSTFVEATFLWVNAAVTAAAYSDVTFEGQVEVSAPQAKVFGKALTPYLPGTEIWPIRWPIGFDPDAYDKYLIERAKEAATQTMRMLTMYRVGGLPITVMPTTTECVHPFTGGQFGNSYVPFYPILLESGSYANCFCNAGCDCAPASTILLREPIGDIRTIQINGEVLDPSAYRVENGNRLVRTDGGSWPSCAGDDFTVTYLNAFPVDEQGQFTAGLLAVEYIKMFLKSTACRLPRHVTDVARGGLSFTVTTQMFPEGTTGIDEVDAWLAQWNPNGLRTMPGVWSPDMDDPRQITWRP